MGEHQSPTLGLPSGMCWLRTSPIHPCGQNWLLCSFVRRPCVKGNKIHGPRYFDRQLFRIILSFPQMDNYFISLNINCFIELLEGTIIATNWSAPKFAVQTDDVIWLSTTFRHLKYIPNFLYVNPVYQSTYINDFTIVSFGHKGFRVLGLTIEYTLEIWIKSINRSLGCFRIKNCLSNNL